MQNKEKFLLRAGCWAVWAAVGYLLLRYLLRYLAPFVLAWAIASMCERGVSFLRKKLRLKRSFLAAVVTLLLAGSVIALTATALSALLRQAMAFLGDLPLYLQQFPLLAENILRRLESFSHAFDPGVQRWLEQGITSAAGHLGTWAGKLSARCLQAIPAALSHLPQAALFTVTSALAVFFTVESYPRIIAFVRRQLPEHLLTRWQTIRAALRLSLGQWLRAQLLLLGITFVQLLAGLTLLRVRYALLLAAVTALIDALPVFGSGIVLLPWAVLCLCTGAIPRGLALTALYAVVTLVHNIAAPKLLAAQSGISPLVSLLAMYAGFCVCGVWGMVLFPLLAMLVVHLQQSGLVHLWK